MTHQVPVIQHNGSVIERSLKALDSWRIRALVVGIGVSAIALIVTVVLPSGQDVETVPGAAAVQDVTSTAFEEFASLFQPRESIPVAPARSAPAVSAPSEPEVISGDALVPVIPVDNTLHPTPSWVNVFSPESTFNGEPLSVGDVITAYDQQGVLIGKTEVEVEGKYGLMALYMDDPSTELDEGANPGETISFRVNDTAALVTGPHEPVWSANGDVLMLNLAVQSN